MDKSIISGLIICYNEEKRIADCIENLKLVCDEIIVIDSFSTDNTKAICKAKGVVFFEEKWQGYGATKNFGGDCAKNNYILSLDADEILDSEAIHAVKSINIDKGHPTYAFARKNYFGTKWIRYGGWYPDKKIRLYDRRKAKWNSKAVHEELILLENKKSYLLDGNILHFTMKNNNEHLETIHKYANLKAIEILENGANISLVKAIGSTIAKFVKMYFLKKGFLDGSLGFVIARNSAYGKWLCYKNITKNR